ncbi:MAG: SAM hydrolase/SAM-dependent halogenase family protein, partial [Ilumatobacteraceae bacterium]
HAVIADIAPHARITDLTHGIAPFDVRAGSLALVRSIGYVPEGVVVAVVDPGVGTERRAVAIEVGDGAGILVGPDNGLLAPAVALAGGAGRAVVLDDPSFHLETPGATFAGRDIFAPVAAHLCNGVDLAELGAAVDPAALMPVTIPLPRHEGDEVIAEVLWVDRFGNCQINLGSEELPPGWGTVLTLRLDDPTSATGSVRRSVRRCSTFGEIGGGIGLVADSHGLFAVCLDRGSAAAELGIGEGDQVVLTDGGGADPVTVPVELGRG